MAVPILKNVLNTVNNCRYFPLNALWRSYFKILKQLSNSVEVEEYALFDTNVIIDELDNDAPTRTVKLNKQTQEEFMVVDTKRNITV